MKWIPTAPDVSTTSVSVGEAAQEVLERLLVRREESRWQQLQVTPDQRTTHKEHPGQLWLDLWFKDPADQQRYRQMQQRLVPLDSMAHYPVKCNFLHALLCRAWHHEIRTGILSLQATEDQLVGEFLAAITGVARERMETGNLVDADLDSLKKAVAALEGFPLRIRHLKPRNYIDFFIAADRLREEADAELMMLAGLERLPLIDSDFPPPAELEKRLHHLSLKWDARFVLFEQDPVEGA